MNHIEKKEILKALNEKELRQDLLIPLLSKMGYIAPIEYHGTNEKGKDIVCFEYDRMNEQRFLAVVAKTGNLSGSASTNAGLMNIVNQVQQAFDNPYEDLYNMRQVFINEVWVVTSGEIVSGAQESVIHTLRKSNLDKYIRIIGDDRLIQLIDTHFNTYWNSTSETKESVIIQRDRLLSFISLLLAANNVDQSTIESVKSSILYSKFNPAVKKHVAGLYISSVSPHSIELSKIDENYDDYIVSNAYGITRNIFQEAKRNMAYSFFDIEETIDKAEKILKLTNPLEFVTQSQKQLKGEYPFTKGYSIGSEFTGNIRTLEDGLNELKYFKAFLKHKGKLEWAIQLAQTTADLLAELEIILKKSQGEEVLINYTIIENSRVAIEYDPTSKNISFSSSFKRIQASGIGSHNRNSDGTLKPVEVMTSALYQLKQYIEELLDYDDSAWFHQYEEE